MGRRKIEIKAIKDDRNRSVTFLKRKGGLFKKAHELSVLCSVEVAVIIFGTNKKLYEYSSHDIHDTINKYQYYGGPHEHKGPIDYAGKQGGGDDDDDEDGEEGTEEQGQNPGHPPQQIPGPVQGPAAMQGQPLYPPHMRHGPSASPQPAGNGNVPYHPRQRTPQPPLSMSRPASRNDIVRRGTPGMQPQHTPPMHTAPMQGPHPHPQNGYPGMPSQVYGQVNGQHMYPQQQQQHPQHNPQHPLPGAFAPQGFTQFPQQHQPHNPRMQHMYQQDQGRGSLPPQFQEPPRPQSHPQVQVQEAPPQIQTMSPPQMHDQNQEGLQPHQPKPVKHNSIYTPIDNSRSMLAASWGLGASPIDKQDTPIKTEPDDRSKSADPAILKRKPDPPAPPKPEPPFQPQRTQSTASLSGDNKSRPRLKVHIPSEPSEDGVSAGSAPASTAKGQATESTTNSTPSKNKDGPGGQGRELPPPSPSASAILSAGATGPPNPFARPLPPQNAGGAVQANAAAFSSNQASGFGEQTPMSALPSRFTNQMLPSPSQFFGDWPAFRNGDESAVLPSPLTFQTPTFPSGPGLGGGSGAEVEGGDDRKRKAEEEKEEKEGAGEKRVKT